MRPLKLRTGFGSVVSLRAPAEFPAASDATAGDAGDHEVGELPRDLHPRHAVHHGRVSLSAGLLHPGGNELQAFHLVEELESKSFPLRLGLLGFLSSCSHGL